MSGKYHKKYKSAGKCDDKNQYKSILEAEMVSTTDIFTDNNPMSPVPSVTVKKPSARNLICLFTEVFDFKQKTAVQRLGAAK